MANYRNYVQLPYQSDIQDGDNLPKVSDDLTTIVKVETTTIPTGSQNTPLSVSPILSMARSLFPSADNTAFVLE